jgi:hypothetical protein
MPPKPKRSAVGTSVNSPTCRHGRHNAEIGSALRLPDSKAATLLQTARTITHDLPMVHAALAAGDISYWHADAIVDATSALSAEKARIVADRVLRRARHQTVGQLRRCLNRAVLAVEPEAAAERVRKAHADRRLDWWPLADGMAELWLIASASDVMAVYHAPPPSPKRCARPFPGQAPRASRRSPRYVPTRWSTSRPAALRRLGRRR